MEPLAQREAPISFVPLIFRQLPLDLAPSPQGVAGRHRASPSAHLDEHLKFADALWRRIRTLWAIISRVPVYSKLWCWYGRQC